MSQAIYRQSHFCLGFLNLQIKVDKKGATFVRKATIGETLKHSAIVTFALVSLPSPIFAGMKYTLNFQRLLATPQLREIVL